jgi:hypothetical protein
MNNDEPGQKQIVDVMHRLSEQWVKDGTLTGAPVFDFRILSKHGLRRYRVIGVDPEQRRLTFAVLK